MAAGGFHITRFEYIIMNSIRIKAYAKINLAIDVKGLLPNGYHEVEMIMQQVELHDEVLVRWFQRKKGGIDILLNTNRPYLPRDERNLAYRAAALMAQKYGGGKSGTIRIDIKKIIPVAAGLAGGSSNAGAVIHAMNRLWDLELSLNQLMDDGKSLGADVPFTIMGQAKHNTVLDDAIRNDPAASSCAYACYDGTRLKAVPALYSNIVLSKPPISVSTKEVYQGIDGVKILQRPDIVELVRGLKEKNCDFIKKNMINVLEFYTLKKYNCIMNTKDKAIQCEGISKVLMSGSGPTVICIADSEASAKAAAEYMKQVNRETFLTRTTL